MPTVLLRQVGMHRYAQVAHIQDRSDAAHTCACAASLPAMLRTTLVAPATTVALACDINSTIRLRTRGRGDANMSAYRRVAVLPIASVVTATASICRPPWSCAQAGRRRRSCSAKCGAGRQAPVATTRWQKSRERRGWPVRRASASHAEASASASCNRMSLARGVTAACEEAWEGRRGDRRCAPLQCGAAPAAMGRGEPPAATGPRLEPTPPAAVLPLPTLCLPSEPVCTHPFNACPAWPCEKPACVPT